MLLEAMQLKVLLYFNHEIFVRYATDHNKGLCQIFSVRIVVTFDDLIFPPLREPRQISEIHSVYLLMTWLIGLTLYNMFSLDFNGYVLTS